MGYNTTSASRASAQSTVASSIVVLPDTTGTGPVLSGGGITATTQINRQVVSVGQSSTQSTTAVTGGGATITSIQAANSSYSVIGGDIYPNSFVVVNGTGFQPQGNLYIGSTIVTGNVFFSSTELRVNLSLTSNLAAGNFPLNYFSPGQSRFANFSSGITMTILPVTAIEYIAVAGGGAGATGNGGNIGNGGGGAGGVLTGTLTGWSGTIAVTIGAGATAPAGSTAGSIASNGSNTSISATGITTVNAIGGGSARAYQASASSSGSGGSGGGGAWTTVSPGTGTAGPPRQGYNGGSGSDAGSPYGAGGGGGANTAGQSVSNLNSYNGGNGGSGYQWLNGTTYAGGGGGGSQTIGGSGGTGGGGAGSGGKGSNASVNTGGGGGGSGGGTAGAGNGGSGIVVLRFPDTWQSSNTTTGSPTVTITGGYRYFTFTQSGTITF